MRLPHKSAFNYITTLTNLIFQNLRSCFSPPISERAHSDPSKSGAVWAVPWGPAPVVHEDARGRPGGDGLPVEEESYPQWRRVRNQTKWKQTACTDRQKNSCRQTKTNMVKNRQFVQTDKKLLIDWKSAYPVTHRQKTGYNADTIEWPRTNNSHKVLVQSFSPKKSSRFVEDFEANVFYDMPEPR